MQYGIITVMDSKITRYANPLLKIVLLSTLVSAAVYSILTLFTDKLTLDTGLPISILIPLFVAPFPTFFILRSRFMLEELTSNLIVQRNKAEMAVKARDSFFANMSHEFRTPLTHIIGFSELLLHKKYLLDEETRDQYLYHILNSSNHLLSIINNVLDLAKIDSNMFHIKREKIDIDHFLDDTLKIFVQDAEKKHVTVSVQREDINDTLFADGAGLKQIVYNLLANAVNFTPPGGTVSLRIYSFPDEKGVPALHFEFKDTGIGMEAGDLERVFSVFEQAGKRNGRSPRGTGIGLSLAKRLVELHGGSLFAESEGIGKGSVFHVVLPFNNTPSKEERADG